MEYKYLCVILGALTQFGCGDEDPPADEGRLMWCSSQVMDSDGDIVVEDPNNPHLFWYGICANSDTPVGTIKWECEEECTDYLARPSGEWELGVKYECNEAKPKGEQCDLSPTGNLDIIPLSGDLECVNTVFDHEDALIRCDESNSDELRVYNQPSPHHVGEWDWLSLPSPETQSTGGTLAAHRNWVLPGASFSPFAIVYKGFAGSSAVSGYVDYSVVPDPRYATCPAEGCQLLVKNVLLKADDFEVEGVDVTNAWFSGGQAIGTISQNGVFSIPSSQFSLQSNFVVGGKSGSARVTPNDIVTGTFNFEDYTLNFDPFAASNDDITVAMAMKSERIALPKSFIGVHCRAGS